MIKKVRKRVGSPRTYSDELKQKVLNAIIREGIGASEAAHRFGIKNESSIRNWVSKYNKKLLVLQYQQSNTTDMQELSKEDLKNKVKELENELSYQKMKSDAFDTMIKVAEKELKISIRKKSDTKQFKN